jgi:hypothetical protein
MRAKDGILQSLTLRSDGKHSTASALVVGSIFFVAALSLFLFVRRATGALTSPLAAPQLAATALVMSLWAVIVQETTAKRAVYFWVSLGTIVLVAIGCSFPAARFVDWLIWLPAISIVALVPLATRLKGIPAGRRRLSAVASETNSEHVLQQLTRFRTADGKDAVRGTVAAELTVGERQTTVYVGFCPPFELLPELEANVADDFEAEVKVVQILHNGAQLDVRLTAPAEELLMLSIEFFAIAGV